MDLGREFGLNGFEPIDLDGNLVHPMCRLSIAPADLVRVTWLSSTRLRDQGLALRTRHPDVPGPQGYGGVLRIDDVESPAIFLWMDTSPSTVDVRCVDIEAGAQLRISNRWRDDRGTEHEWLNNYGMLIEELDADRYELRCSDGIGAAPTFDDLVVRVSIERARSSV